MTALTAAPAVRRKPGRTPAGTVRSGMTLAWRNVLQLKHSPQKLVEVTLLPIVFLVLFLYVFGGALAGDTSSYLQLLLPGLIAQMAMFATMGLGASMNEDIHRGVFDRFRTMPIARSAPLLGAVLGDTVRFCITMSVLTSLGAALGFRFHNDLLSILAAYGLAYLYYLSISWFSLLVGLMAPSPDAVQGFTFMWSMPLTFGSSVFMADTSSMPGWLRSWVDINPISQLADAIRALTLGTPAGNHIWFSLLWAAAIALVAFPLALVAYNRRL
ncbi:ABC transporter permease [Actinomadura rubrisoli]|uniref:Transport permease protein n=1 Tax=Actinomadura rubrisoli TaxID=2530368 RepID=A0A4R5C6C9_9ACTN|nr:ABC transporter permease [Actinomadura rubrisoli]TDD94239.1 ABC transporter permease [Actinomadura rubrisoli]